MTLWGIEGIDWIKFLGTAVGFTLIIWLARIIVARQLSKLAAKTKTDIDDIFIDALKRTHLFLMFLVGLVIGSKWLTLSEKFETIPNIVFKLALLFQAAIWVHALLNGFLARFANRDSDTDTSKQPGVRAIRFIVNLAVWSVVLIFALDNLGVNISTMIAGLGIGGIAVALALQNTLSDLFCFVTIIFDKPFEVGDFIIVGDHLGAVEHVGIKSTRIRSLGGEQIVISNNDLVSSRIKNYKRMQERRIVFSIGVIYETPSEKLNRIPTMIRDIIDATSNTRFDRAHFSKFGDFSLDFEIVYYVLTSDYNVYMDIQQALNLAIFKKFEEEGIVFAYPTQMLYVSNANKDAAGK